VSTPLRTGSVDRVWVRVVPLIIALLVVCAVGPALLW
jgi:hypothetical protein